MNYCQRCANEIEMEECFCAPCSDIIPDSFECILCEDDFFKDGFGAFSNDKISGPICAGCVQDLKNESLQDKYYSEDQYKDFFGEEYYEDQL